MIRMILAVDKGGALGWSDGRLAYPKLRGDMLRFKQLTTYGTVVMGFNTFMSLGRHEGLPNRHNIVMTRRHPLALRGTFEDGVDVISSFDYIRRVSKQDPARNIWVIGGKSVYEEVLKCGDVDEIYLTLIHSTCDADVVMDTDLVAWKLFVLREQDRGISWDVDIGATQPDGDVETTYVTFRKIHE